MSDQPSLSASARELLVARTALHRAIDLLENMDTESLEVGEALELIFLALEELAPEPPAR
jgi:hypothetical protein